MIYERAPFGGPFRFRAGSLLSRCVHRVHISAWGSSGRSKKIFFAAGPEECLPDCVHGVRRPSRQLFGSDAGYRERFDVLALLTGPFFFGPTFFFAAGLRCGGAFFAAVFLAMGRAGRCGLSMAWPWASCGTGGQAGGGGGGGRPASKSAVASTAFAAELRTWSSRAGSWMTTRITPPGMLTP